ncbi:MAG: zinc-binding dehydrogenase [Solirubrobacterales bacterium]|nr:zinc-binding dehydrogenase [Solirubrobacterales bacterium]
MTTDRTMRAAVVVGGGEMRIGQVPRPAPGRGEVRVALEGCGVCGSDLPVWEGRSWFDYPRPAGAPGHEGWGRIDAVGADVEQPSIGARVAILGYHSYSEYEVVDADRLVVLPALLDDQPFPGEPLGCAVNAFHRAQVGARDTVAVIGAGFLGCLLIGLAASAGARVIAVSRRATARRAAAAMGAEITLAPEDRERLAQLTAGQGCDLAIEAAGRQDTLDLAGDLVRVRGRLVIAGYHQDGPRTVDMQSWNWRGLDIINAHERDRSVYLDGIRGAVDAIASGRLDPRPLYTDRYSLSGLGEAFTAMRERPAGFIKALVTV